MVSSFTGFLDHTQRRPTDGKLLWTSDQLVAETSTSQHTNIHVSGGIRTHDRSRRAAVDRTATGTGIWGDNGGKKKEVYLY
jgi:hypothetical protein